MFLSSIFSYLCLFLRSILQFNTLVWIFILSPFIRFFLSGDSPQEIYINNKKVEEIKPIPTPMETPTATKSQIEEIIQEAKKEIKVELNKQPEVPPLEFPYLQYENSTNYFIQKLVVDNIYDDGGKYDGKEAQILTEEKFWNATNFDLIEIQHKNGQTEKKHFWQKRVSKMDGLWCAKGGGGVFRYDITQPILVEGITLNTRLDKRCKLMNLSVVSDKNPVLSFEGIPIKENTTILFQNPFLSKYLDINLTYSDCPTNPNTMYCISQFYLLPYDYNKY